MTAQKTNKNRKDLFYVFSPLNLDNFAEIWPIFVLDIFHESDHYE